MGNDGGSIPKRRELVKNASRAPNMSEMKATALEVLTHAWAHCALTAEPLDLSNVVSDWRGRLYNYESILRGLKPEAAAPPTERFQAAFDATGIKSLRDIQKLKVTLSPTPGKNGAEVAVCPVSLKELGPSARAAYLVPCGHVFAEVVFKEVKDLACPECGEAYKEENIILIMPTEEADVKRLFARIEALREAGLTHTLKKDKSGGKKKRKATAEDKGTSSVSKDSDGQDSGITRGAHERRAGINNAMAASLTAKVLADQEDKSKKRKLEPAQKAGTATFA